MHDHHHNHEHSHVPTVSRGNEKTVLLALVLTTTFMVVEAIGGVISGSLALLADAGHMLVDSMALALAYFAFRIGRRKADSRRSFGYLRVEVVAGFVNALTLFAIVVWIGFEAVERIRNPGEILTGMMLVVAVAGLLINILVFWILSRGDTDHVNIQGALLHVLGDLLGSVGAIAAALIITYTGWTIADPILSVFVALLILRSAWKLLQRSLHILLEGSPEGASAIEIEEHLRKAIPELGNVYHIHSWSLTSGEVLATLHITPKDGSNPFDVVNRVKHELESAFGISHSTIEIGRDPHKHGDCSLSAHTHPPHESHH